MNGGISTAVSTVTTNVTLPWDASVVLVNNAALVTVTLPGASTCKGRQITVKKISADVAGAVNVQAGGTDGLDVGTVYSLAVQNEWVILVSNGVNRWYTVGR